MEDEATQPRSISARIAALKLDQVGKQTGVQNEKKGHLLAPPNFRPSNDVRRHTANNPPLRTNGSSAACTIGNEPISSDYETILPQTFTKPDVQGGVPGSRPSLPPRLPPRPTSARPVPPLPPRTTSGSMLKRRDSIESVSSAFSNLSSCSAVTVGTALTPASRSSVDLTPHRIMAPAYDPATLPSLPPKASEGIAKKTRAPLKSRQTSLSTSNAASEARLHLQKAPPQLPLRQVNAGESGNLSEPPSVARPSALSFALNKPSELPPPLPSSRPSSPQQGSTDLSHSDAPPPIPLASRPASKALLPSTSGAQIASKDRCLKCRDFSEPDRHAARFPRQSVPSTSTEWLAHQLTSPFPCLTDKARALFTWLHLNIEYDVQAFFNGSINPSTPSSTISTGLAVCEGYAGLFSALATKAGLESVVVGGHGKGFGFSPVAPNTPIPPYSAGHAWNAVKIDHGEWKLIDCCWGAGAVNGKGQPYIKRFAPSFFTMDNDEFGLRHFPENSAYFYRRDGRRPTWEEYVLGDTAGEPPQIFSGAQDEHGLSETSFNPKYKKVPTHTTGPGPLSIHTTRFQFSKVCPHWDNEIMGKGKSYQFILAVKGNGGVRDDTLPFETNGQSWWCDVRAAHLGVPGQIITLFAVTTVNGMDARGMTLAEFNAAKGKKGMGFAGIAAWELI